MEAECSDSGAVEYPMIWMLAVCQNIRRDSAREMLRRARISDDILQEKRHDVPECPTIFCTRNIATAARSNIR